jgi:photosystem II stability/assembly factor-like uncharacterized protein
MCSGRLLSYKALVLAGLLVAGGPAEAFQDPTEVPAMKSELLPLNPLTAVTTVGARSIAVGQRGHIGLSDDGGQTWRQAAVPVSSDLVAVSFPTEQHGWAVGHGGVVLHSEDGGETWVKQLDGEDAIRLILDYYGENGAGASLPDAAMYAEREENLVSFGGTQPLMAVQFINVHEGFVAGLFNRLLHTRDGGKTWEPWQHRIDNLDELHFYSLTADEQAYYITGEQGMVWRMPLDGESFAAIPTGYSGTLFGAISNGQLLVAFGMRGTVYRSEDSGSNWSEVVLDTEAGITSGSFLSDGTLLLGSLAGEILRSSDAGKTYTLVALEKRMPYFGLAAKSNGNLMLVGAAGAQRAAVVLADVQSHKPAELVIKRGAGSDAEERGADYGHGER